MGGLDVSLPYVSTSNKSGERKNIGGEGEEVGSTVCVCHFDLGFGDGEWRDRERCFGEE